MKRIGILVTLLSFASAGVSFLYASGELIIASDGRTSAVICVSIPAVPDQSETPKTKKVKPQVPLQRKAAEDLARYIEAMTGARPAILDEPAAIEAAMSKDVPVFVIGDLALDNQPGLRETLSGISPKRRIYDPDAVVLRRDQNRVYLAGSTDRAHYYAVVTLLNHWGCRWYMPTEFGEVIPERPQLTLGALNMAHASPFEMRNYWIAWGGSNLGGEDFMLRNFMSPERLNTMHILKRYTKGVIPEGGSAFGVALTAPETALEVANQIEKQYAEGKNISLSMEDGVYTSQYPGDIEMVANIHDKYFQSQSMADSFLRLYVNVAEALQQRHPESKATLSFLAYSNMTIPPQWEIKPPASLVAEIAPIDIDPNHSVDDPRAPSRQEYKEMVKQWADVMDKRLAIYDYDQSALVWRDLPNPSHHVMRSDIPFYRDVGAIGISTESRGAFATTFTNIFFRGQLMWNPDVDTNALLEEFYPSFYGAAAAPMKRYWGAIYSAWEETIVSEHEFYMIPAIYTRELVGELRIAMDEALAAVKPLRGKAAESLSRNERLVLDRVDFTRKSFDLIDQYTGMVHAAATEGDYKKAVELGRAALQTRLAIADLSPVLTTGVIGRAPEAAFNKKGELNATWLSGEVEQFAELDTLTNGSKGMLIKRLPLEWAFRRDPHDTGLPRGFAKQKASLAFWELHKDRYVTPEQRKDFPTTEWEVLRSDLYVQAQGVLHPDWQSFTGFLWYQTPVEMTDAEAQGNLRVRFPGLFSEAWLYVNGALVAHRPQRHIWWKNNYRFDWDVDLAGKLKPGSNDITLRVHNTHHNGGLFRRPFIYRTH